LAQASPRTAISGCTGLSYHLPLAGCCLKMQPLSAITGEGAKGRRLASSVTSHAQLKVSSNCAINITHSISAHRPERARTLPSSRKGSYKRLPPRIFPLPLALPSRDSSSTDWIEYVEACGNASRQLEASVNLNLTPLLTGMTGATATLSLVPKGTNPAMENPRTSQCLNVPVPCCMRRVVMPLGPCAEESRDRDALRLLGALGNDMNATDEQISKACDLASGRSDILVLMDCPVGRKGEDVQDCHSEDTPVASRCELDPVVHCRQTRGFADELVRRHREVLACNKWTEKHRQRCSEVAETFARTKLPSVIVIRTKNGGKSTLL